jgi:ABC-2 type transport system permease protein
MERTRMKPSFWKTVAWIAQDEWRAMRRSRVTLAAGSIALLLALAATLVGIEKRHAIESERARYQATADQQWDAQPDRHPHRVVHYGHYVFRPLSPLAFFDFGVDPFTGHTLYLEGHRQNSANFSDASQSSVLLRFGLLTPAFVLQTLVPLLVIFVAFGSVARERERGQLRMILAQGVSGMRLLAGKLLSHAALTALIASPALAALAAVAVLGESSALQSVLMILGYVLYLLMWVTLAVLVSAFVSRARHALMVLVSVWIGTVILLPRILPDIASASVLLPTRIETEVAIHKDLAAIGDSHDPADPHFAEFRAKTLAQYGVSRVEDLPVNYAGLLMAEGERLTSELFDRYMQDNFKRQDAQGRFVNAFSLLSPVLALRQMSMALAGTDRGSHQQFLIEAEKYRFALIQALNRLHAEQVRYKNDREQRISHRHWQDLPRFAYQSPDLEQVVTDHVIPALAVLGLWLVLLGAGMVQLAKRLEGTGR